MSLEPQTKAERRMERKATAKTRDLALREKRRQKAGCRAPVPNREHYTDAQEEAHDSVYSFLLAEAIEEQMCEFSNHVPNEELKHERKRVHVDVHDILQVGGLCPLC